MSCSYAGPALSMLVDVYPDSFAFVQLHIYDSQATPWGDDRWVFYNGLYTPTAVFDGTDAVVGAVSDYDQQYNIYRAYHFLPRRAITTDVTIELSAEPISGPTYRASALVGIEAGGTGKTLRIYMVQVLDHWPATPTYSRNTFKQAAPTQDITLAPGESQIVQNDFTFDADSWTYQEDIKLVAWAQAPVEGAPAEIYQAVTRVWPLVSYPNDADGDGFLDTIDNCPGRYNPDQADGDGDEVGDVCDNCDTLSNSDQRDTDEDSVGDACDNCPVMHHLNQDDSDGDGVGDVCDSCPEVSAPGGIDGFGRSLGAIDIDCDVDLDDYVVLAACLGGAGITTPPPECDPDDFTRSDVDDDGDVDLEDSSVFVVNFTGPLVSPPLYVGVTSCTECHLDQHTSWTGTIHATAFDTLTAAGEGDNPLCFPCHSVGYGVASGFVDLGTTPDLAGVQCENCHGPGSNHVADPENVDLPVNLSASLCGACHQSCHGLCGEDHHPQYEQWSESKHSTALPDIQWLPEADDSCLQCHSTDYRLAPEGQEPTLLEAVYSVECVACHGPHGTANVGQLRLPPNLLCAECHTMQGAVPVAEPDQPQVEMLHGFGGFALDGAPLNGPYTEHWWGIPDECAACHVHAEPYGGPEQPVNSGHTFQANMRACEPCHSEETATILVAITQEEIATRLATIARYYDPGDPLYVDPTLLSPEELAQYDIATFNYQFVQNDKSYGSHSGGYARELLSETESFFGIPPWLFLIPGDGSGGGLDGAPGSAAKRRRPDED
ncbi:MAG: thrombospondin type 3 repeat-containing protein [Phycisphaerales bacterium]|nr:MAG: thrombospondin type 3 repeat-containing protein [Phycisphaerales bacterium]